MRHHRTLPLVLLSLAVPAEASPADQALAQCRPLADPAERLACYDRIVDAKRTGVETSTPRPERQEIPAAPPASASKDGRAQDRFGKRRHEAKEEEVRAIRSRIVTVDQSAHGNDLITLANGQIWMENEGSTWRVMADQEVVVTKGIFSFTLTLESGRRIKVHRIE